MSTSSPNDFNARIIEQFRANGGRVGEPFENTPLLLLHHTGARTGTARVNPVARATSLKVNSGRVSSKARMTASPRSSD